MKQGMTLDSLAELLDFQHENHSDIIVNTETMVVPVPTADNTFSIKFIDRTRRKSRMFEYPLTRYALIQLAHHVNVPIALIDRMVEGTEMERKEISRLLTVRLKENPMGRMLRTIVGGPNRDVQYIRAFLSDRYRTLDNYDLLQAIFPVMQELKGQLKVESCSVTENRMYIKFRYPTVKGSLGTIHKNGAEVDDIVEAGVIISNSEVGDGPVRVQPYLLRLTCKNGATVTLRKRGQRKIHIGRRANSGDPLHLIESRAREDADFFARIGEMLKEVIKDKDFYLNAIDKFRATKLDYLLDTKAAVKAVARMFKLVEWEAEGVEWYLTSVVRATYTRFDLINAVTRMARSTDKRLSYDRASEMEEMGGRLIEMGRAEWKIIGNAKEKKPYEK